MRALITTLVNFLTGQETPDPELDELARVREMNELRARIAHCHQRIRLDRERLEQLRAEPIVQRLRAVGGL